MNVYALPRRTRRILAAGLLAGALVAPLTGLWWLASVAVFDQASRVAAIESRMASLNAVSGSITDLRRVWAQLERDARFAVDLYPPVSDAQAAAAVQAAAQKIVSRTGAIVRSVEVLDVADDGPVRRVGVRLVVTCTSNQFNQAIAAIAGARPILLITGGDVRVMGDSRRPINGAGAPSLQSTLDVFAFVRKS